MGNIYYLLDVPLSDNDVITIYVLAGTLLLIFLVTRAPHNRKRRGSDPYTPPPKPVHPLGADFEKDKEVFGFIPATKIHYSDFGNAFLEKLTIDELLKLVKCFDQIPHAIMGVRRTAIVQFYVKKILQQDKVTVEQLFSDYEELMNPRFSIDGCEARKFTVPNLKNATIQEIEMMLLEKKICGNDVEKWRKVYSTPISKYYRDSLHDLLLKKISTLTYG